MFAMAAEARSGGGGSSGRGRRSPSDAICVVDIFRERRQGACDGSQKAFCAARKPCWLFAFFFLSSAFGDVGLL